MNARGQGALFELLSGLFGWLWIGAAVAALVFAGLALLGDWSWWNVLYAAIVSGVSKWLARGFLDNRNRVAFEAETVAKGMSPEKAAQYTGQAEERVNIISDYGAFMELPHDKQIILKVICEQIARENDDKRIEALKTGALCLADYQEGVGDQPISMLGVDLTSMDLSSLSDEAL